MIAGIEEFRDALERFGGRWRRFTALESLGNGGQGCVWRVRDDNGREMAIKWGRVERSPNPSEFFRLEFERRKLRLLREAQIQRRLADCPYALRYYDHELHMTEDGPCAEQLLAMELAVPLLQDVEKNIYSAQEIIRLGVVLTYAVEALQAISARHNDLSRHNIFLRPGTGDKQFVLGDFGLALYESDIKCEDRNFKDPLQDVKQIVAVTGELIWMREKSYNVSPEPLSSQCKPFYPPPTCAPVLMELITQYRHMRKWHSTWPYTTPAELRRVLEAADLEIRTQKQEKIEQFKPLCFCDDRTHWEACQ